MNTTQHNTTPVMHTFLLLSGNTFPQPSAETSLFCRHCKHVYNNRLNPNYVWFQRNWPKTKAHEAKEYRMKTLPATVSTRRAAATPYRSASAQTSWPNGQRLRSECCQPRPRYRCLFIYKSPEILSAVMLATKRHTASLLPPSFAAFSTTQYSLTGVRQDEVHQTAHRAVLTVVLLHHKHNYISWSATTVLLVHTQFNLHPVLHNSVHSVHINL